MQVQSRGCRTCASCAARPRRHGTEAMVPGAGNPGLHTGARRQPQHQRPRPRAARPGPWRAGGGPAGTCVARPWRPVFPSPFVQPAKWRHAKQLHPSRGGVSLERGAAHAAAAAAARSRSTTASIGPLGRRTSRGGRRSLRRSSPPPSWPRPSCANRRARPLNARPSLP
jgi:hypothetical protein